MSRRVPDIILVFGVIFLLVISCAKISTPTGGKRDRLPPVVLGSKPENRTVNFGGRKIEITFDEFVVLDNISEKLMVSPPLEKRPEITVKKKSIIAQFDEKLKENTTYTFYFQDAIKDLNEGNILENYQFVFSTGPFVDSLSVTGNVYTALNLDIPEKTLVLMYRNLEDSAVIKNLPDYLSMVDVTGYFRIENVHEGTYRLYALKDADNSKNYNLRDEEFAFLDTVIKVTPEQNFLPIEKDTINIDTVKVKAELVKAKAEPGKKQLPPEPIARKGVHQLILFTAQKKAHYLASSARPQKYQLLYVLSIPPDSLKFDFSIPDVSPDSYMIEKSLQEDTVKVWLTDSSLYSQPQIKTLVTYPFTDSAGVNGYKHDTIPMRFLQPRETRASKVKAPAYTVDYNISRGSLKPGQKIVIGSETPFRNPDTTRIKLYEILDSSKIKMNYKLIRDSLNSGRYIVESPLEIKKQYLFIADTAAFGNIFHQSADSVGYKFTVKDPETYSKLTLNINNYEGNLIIQLLAAGEKIVDQKYRTTEKSIVFPLLEPGLYRVRAIYDLNGDGKWTTGDFDTKREPEPVSYYPAEINLPIGFYVDQDWDLSKFNYKEQKLRGKQKGK